MDLQRIKQAQPLTKRSWFQITPMIFFILGIVFWGGFNWSMEATNSESFCVSCHEMNVNVYQEYKKTVHYKNPTGVRATCPDCHVPKEWVHKVIRKIRATNELYHWIIGSIDTREKFLTKRARLASHVWKGMEQTDSRECRNCHDEKAMTLEKQASRASKIHELNLGWGMTCIQCHQGIAHNLPNSFDKESIIDGWHKKIEKEKVACHECHKGMPAPPSKDDW